MITNITANNLCCIRNGRLLFKNLSFNLQQKQALHIVGCNGVGKSSLLKLLSGFLSPVKGEVNYNKLNLYNNLAMQQYINFIDSIDICNKNLTGQENLNFWTHTHTQGNLNSINNAINTFNIQNVINDKIGTYSQGQKQKLVLCKLLSINAKLWILDEPFNYLDNNSVNVLKELFANHLKNGGIIVLVSHNFKDDNFKQLNLNNYIGEKV